MPRKSFSFPFRAAVVVVVAAAIAGTGLSPDPVAAQTEGLKASKSATYESSAVRIKLREGVDVRHDGHGFTGSGAGDLNRVLARVQAKGQNKLIDDDAAQIDASTQKLRNSGKSVANLNTFFQIELGAGVDSAGIVAELERVAAVEDAYPAPRPVRSPASPDLSVSQNYRATAPGGLGVTTATSWPGATASGVQIFDLEYSWNTAHEDLSKLRAPGAMVPLGTPYDPFSDSNHGTAVVGILTGDQNGYGVTGTVRDARVRLVNTNTTMMWNPAGAIYTAARNAVPGDVIILEQQAYGPTGDANELVPVEWIPDVYHAIKYVTAKGIIVIEAAGNGGRNLNDSIYGSSFPEGRSDSGAIIVGAGAACQFGQPARSRLYFSNYGSRVNLQGWGECVTSTGYGDGYFGGDNASYTNAFSGTSSATPIVAAAAAAYVGAYKKLNGVAPSPAQVRSDLVATGTPQSYLVTHPGKIGPQPNLSWALKRTDLTPPTAPGSPKVVLNATTQPVVTWAAATDNVGVANYRVFRNGTYLKTVTTGTNFTDSTAPKGTSVNYAVYAVDRTDKFSSASPTVTIKVP